MTKLTLPALIVALAAATADIANAQYTSDHMGNPPPSFEVGDAYLNTQVMVTDTDGVEGFTTYRLTVTPESTNVKNIYAIYGDKTAVMQMPAAFHVPAPFGATIGGTNPAFWSIKPQAKFDSWLTVGISTGNVHNDISSIGIDWDHWTDRGDLTAADGAIFWMDPDNGPAINAGETVEGQEETTQYADGGVIIGQLTLQSAPDHFPPPADCIFSAQGRSFHGPDWDQRNLRFQLSQANSVAPTPAPADNIGATNLYAPQHCTQVQQSIFRRCISDCAKCLQHMHSYLTVVGDCIDATDCLETGIPCATNGNEDLRPAAAEMQSICSAAPAPAVPAKLSLVVPADENPGCSVATLQATFNAIENICCAGQGEGCFSGVPTRCDAQCKDVVLDFRDRCANLLASMPSGFTNFDEFVGVCEAPPPPPAIAVHVSNLVNALTAATKKVPTYSCTYDEVMGIALECSDTSPHDMLGSGFCTSSCAGKLLPFGKQCASTMGAPLAIFGLADTVSVMLSTCDDVDLDTSVCPLDKIVRDCSDSDAMARPGNVCNTPCVQTISAHYDACATSKEPEVVALFSEQSWGPLVSVCSEKTGKSSDVITQCAAVEQRITAQLSEVCSASVYDPAPRTDPDVMPTKCSHQCASVLMPFYHDCASELMASSPELLARLTGLAAICSNQPGH